MDQQTNKSSLSRFMGYNIHVKKKKLICTSLFFFYILRTDLYIHGISSKLKGRNCYRGGRMIVSFISIYAVSALYVIIKHISDPK
jgi:hypothetical protein